MILLAFGRQSVVISSASASCLRLKLRNVVLIRFLVAEGVGVSLDRLCAAIHKAKRSGMFSSGVVLLYDNALPHTATRILNKLRKFGWTVLEHQPYSPDLSPCDFHIVGPLKKTLKGSRFTRTVK
ncbi:hypothetical protein AVEN_69862-1 [Araneus ventricosus]|uniref:Tc1-like transposase DDE domain-containing protein n=1 Tax=Araneus ventricosus TaxID=182803 RepID=A0A4Y2U7X5_ARAVE|nr:hypothetical protein AVEN_137360-1 [Araneus ventricosus]GBO05770.1 hypothetical protein AVEN_61930-1 [Araneus ventricosus]GBO07796.1 hypothetical protein AVEN_54397-1 [Araneus ventricosus]GBO07808.1 hypothetical protein AVEN_69862-1 [Araneus ventricosus]